MNALSFLLVVSFTESASGSVTGQAVVTKWGWSVPECSGLSWAVFLPICWSVRRIKSLDWQWICSRGCFLKEDQCFLTLLASPKYLHFKYPKSLIFFNKALIFLQVSGNLSLATQARLWSSQASWPSLARPQMENAFSSQGYALNWCPLSAFQQAHLKGAPVSLQSLLEATLPTASNTGTPPSCQQASMLQG